MIDSGSRRMRLGPTFNAFVRPMPSIDLVLTAELVLALLLVATLEAPAPKSTAPEPPPEESAATGWKPEHDSHARRLLRLESRERAPGYTQQRLPSDGRS